jgi:hypothetical protein
MHVSKPGFYPLDRAKKHPEAGLYVFQNRGLREPDHCVPALYRRHGWAYTRVPEWEGSWLFPSWA